MDDILSNGGWKILKRRTVYENRFGLKVFEDEVVTPNGEEGIYGWVKLNSGVSVLPVDKNRQVYLGKEFQLQLEKSV